MNLTGPALRLRPPVAGCGRRLPPAVGHLPLSPNSFSTDPIRKLSLLLGLRDNAAGFSSLERLLLWWARGQRAEVRSQRSEVWGQKMMSALASKIVVITGATGAGRLGHCPRGTWIRARPRARPSSCPCEASGAQHGAIVTFRTIRVVDRIAGLRGGLGVNPGERGNRNKGRIPIFGSFPRIVTDGTRQD